MMMSSRFAPHAGVLHSRLTAALREIPIWDTADRDLRSLVDGEYTDSSSAGPRLVPVRLPIRSITRLKSERERFRNGREPKTAMRRALKLHPDSQCDAVERIDVDVARL